MWKRAMLGMLLLALCGCIKTKDELTINADGSGKVRLEAVSSVPAEYAQGLGMASRRGGEGGIIYPPVSEAEAHQYFPAKDFKVTVKQQKADNGDTTTVIEAEFKDLNALLASPYGKAHELSVKIADGSLVVRGISGLGAAARLADVKGTDLEMLPIPALAELQKKTNEMRSEFSITLPRPISSANGNQAGQTATWVVERAKCKDGADFAQQLAIVAEAKCPAEGLKLAPVTPIRLGLLPFAELAEEAAAADTAVDTNKVLAAVKYVPYGLSVTRSLDLSGEGGGQRNSAELVGALTIPRELAPRKWGSPELTEATDAKGNNLKLSDKDDITSRIMMGNRFSSSADDDSEDSENSATNTNDRVQTQIVTLAFRPPDWKVGEVARVQGSVALQYFGGSQVIKLTNAVPAKWIKDMSQMAGGGFDRSEKTLQHPALEKLGLNLTVQSCMVQGGITVLMLQTEGKQAAILDAQAFDAAGTPWPTFLQQSEAGGGDSGPCQIMVTGKPQPPLSLALQVSGGGTTVEAPILVEHVSLLK